MRLSLRKLILYILMLNLVFFLFYAYTINSHQNITFAENLKLFESLDLTPSSTPKMVTQPVTQVTRRSGSCMQLTRPNEFPPKETWQNVGGNSKNYVFSAYFDNIDNPQIRIIGLKERRSNLGLFCQIWYSDERELEIVEVTRKQIPEDHMKRYSATFYFCSIKGKGSPPYAVSLVTWRCESASNLLSIQYSARSEWKFSLCLSPFNFKYSRAYELVEMIELNRLLGVEHFVFYNQSIGTNVDTVLRKYTREGIVQVVQWKLPIRVDSWPQDHKQEVHYFAQLAALNDCLYRNVNRSTYVVFTDLDEFVIPKNQTDLPSLLSVLDKNEERYGAFIFPCVFFRKDWPQYSDFFKGRIIAEKYQSVTLLTVMREAKIWPILQRSKYIVKPLAVETVGIHTIWGWRRGYKSYRARPDVALLHHYRDWENPTEGISRHSDLIIHKHYADRLIEKLAERWNSLPNVPLDIPLNNYSFPLR